MQMIKWKQPQQILKYPITAFVIFFAGLVIGWYAHTLVFNFLNLQYDENITFNVDLIGIVSLLVSSMLAMFVVRRLQRGDEYANAEKYSHKKYLENFRDKFLEGIGKATDGAELEHLYDLFKSSWVELEPLLERAQKRNLILENSETKKEIIEKFTDLKQLFTTTPKAGAVEDGVHVNGNSVTFSDKHKAEIKNARLDFDAYICELIFNEIMNTD